MHKNPELTRALNRITEHLLLCHDKEVKVTDFDSDCRVESRRLEGLILLSCKIY